MQEIFKDIPGYDGNYQISNLGNIQSFKRKNHVILKAGIDKHGYFVVVLVNEFGKKTRSVHQLVAITFLGHTPSGSKLVVNHKDLNKQNNNVNNLELISCRENTIHYHKITKSLPTGVTMDKSGNRYLAKIYFKGKGIHLGTFATREKAESEYLKAIDSIQKETFKIPEPRKCTSEYKGISYAKKNKKWRAYFSIKSVTKTIGNYDTEKEAYEARKEFIKNLNQTKK